MTTKTFALLEYMKLEGYHQLPFENCKIPENHNYVEKLNFGINIDFIPINTRLNLLISDSPETTDITNGESTVADTGETNSTTEAAEALRVLESNKGREFLSL